MCVPRKGTNDCNGDTVAASPSNSGDFLISAYLHTHATEAVSELPFSLAFESGIPFNIFILIYMKFEPALKTRLKFPL